MTDLQTSLMAIGGTIVVGVISYNKWQEYKAKRSVERAFSSEHDDVLMSPGPESSVVNIERHEPALPSAIFDPADDEDSSLVGLGDQPVEKGDGTPPRQLEASPPAPQKDLPVDGLIDCIIPFVLGA